MPAASAGGGYRVPYEPGEVQWADAHWNKHVYSIRDDCTNFVSYALYYGGHLPWQTKYKTPGTAGIHNDNNWFRNPGLDVSTLSWVFAFHNFVWQEKQGAYFLTYTGDAVPGDLIWANWKGGPGTGISHMGVISVVHGNNPYIDQHTRPRKRIPLWKTGKAYTWQSDNPHLSVWIAIPQERT